MAAEPTEPNQEQLMSYPNPGQQGNPQPYGADSYGQQNPHGQPVAAQPGYGNSGYQPGYPGYSAEGAAAPLRSNPIAGILLLIGGLAGLGAGWIPVHGLDKPGILLAVDYLFEGGLEAGTTDQTLVVAAYIAATFGGLLAVIASISMFAARRHAGSASTGMFAAILQVAAGIVVLVVSAGDVLNASDISPWLLVFGGIPTLLGAIIGFARK